MRAKIYATLFACLSIFGFSNNIHALEMPDFMANTPVGSWVTTENTIQRGKKTEITQITKSLVGEEMLNGKRHVWLEVKTQLFKVSRKGKRKPKGDPSYIKMLSDASMFNNDASNIMANLQKVAVKMYVKNGDNVMDMSGGGAFASSMMQASGSSLEYNMTDLKKDRKIETPLGLVSAHGYRGVGDFEMKIIIKTIKTHSEAEMWLSKDVPFGMVEMTNVSTINKKQETSTSKLIAGGFSGAKSEVDISAATENPFSFLNNLKK